MTGKVVVLTGGVGGSKLVHGLARLLPAQDVTAIVNTGDDFLHLGLDVSPDIDTLLYTLSGQADPQQGWGRAGETWQFMAAVERLGAESWFRLGDGDLALHVLRTRALAAGERLSSVTHAFARQWGIGITILPMSDDRLETLVDSDEGELPFQHYFVKRRCEPRVRAIRFRQAPAASPAPGVIEAIADPATRAVILAPSNPFLSIDPILAVPGLRDALRETPVPVVAVSPLVGGRAVKGPTAKIMAELGLEVSAATVAAHYGDFLDGMLIDESDPEAALPLRSARADILMTDVEDRMRVAAAALSLADMLRK